MKKKYESPMAEKYDFNYVENVVASETTESETIAAGSGNYSPIVPSLKRTSGGNNGCYHGSKNETTNCTATYD